MPARVEELCGLVFVNLDPDATPLADLVGDLPAAAGAATGSRRSSPFAPGDGDQPANWKAVADNYLEGYHIPIAHPGLMRMLDYKHYDVEVHEHYVWFDAPLRDKPSSNRLERLYARLVTPMPGLGEADRLIWRYAFIYPNTTIDLYPDQVNTWQMLPDGVGRTHRHVARLPPGRTDPRTRLVQWANQPPEHARARRGHRPRRQRPAGAADARLRCGPLSRARARGGVVRRPDPRRPGPGAQETA